MRPHGTAEQLEYRRRQAVMQVQQGRSPQQVAQCLGVHPSSVSRWVDAFGHKGPAGLASQPTPGRPCKLTGPQRRGLVQRLLAGAPAQGYPTDLWTCPRIADLIQRRYGVHYHVDHVPRLLESLDFSPQRPEKQAVERDPVEIARWIQQDWPRIKKTLPAGERT